MALFQQENGQRSAGIIDWPVVYASNECHIDQRRTKRARNVRPKRTGIIIEAYLWYIKQYVEFLTKTFIIDTIFDRAREGFRQIYQISKIMLLFGILICKINGGGRIFFYQFKPNF